MVGAGGAEQGSGGSLATGGYAAMPSVDASSTGGASGVDGAVSSWPDAGACCGGVCPLVNGYSQVCVLGVCTLNPNGGTCVVDSGCAPGHRCIGASVCCGPKCSGKLGICVADGDAGHAADGG
jgi:hypothetical protein